MNPESPAGVVLLGLGAWTAVLVPVYLWRLLRGESPAPAMPDEPSEPDDDGDDYEPAPLAAEFSGTVPFDSAVLIGPRDRGDA